MEQLETPRFFARRSRHVQMTPPHLVPGYFEEMWETVNFTSSHCAFIYTPGVHTLDTVVSSSLLAACVAWIVILLASWLLIAGASAFILAQTAV